MRLVKELLGPSLDFRVVVAEVLFMLVMVELVRLLILYLEEHRVAVDFMVELGIVATLREIVLRGVIELTWQQITALSVFFVALGALLRFADLRAPDSPLLGRGDISRGTDGSHAGAVQADTAPRAGA